METLVQRLVANPHDEQALAYAHHAGTQDPRAYAALLEKVGTMTADPAYAAHWLSEAANVWATTLGDAHHAASTLMIAIEKDPTHRTAAERLAQLYRDKGDQKALVALLEKLVKSLSGRVHERPDIRPQLAALHEELGRLWSEPPLSRPERALENWRRLAELDPQNAYAIYAAREMLKSLQQFADAVPYFGMEQALVDDPERKLALYRDEAEIRKRAGDGPGATQCLRNAFAMRPDDVALKQELGLSIVERATSGEAVPAAEREEAARLFVSLAETYDGEYGFSYASSALQAMPGDDRAMQLADYYGKALGRTAELGPVYAAYVAANPSGFMAAEARSRASAPPAVSAGSAASRASMPSMSAAVAAAESAYPQQAPAAQFQAPAAQPAAVQPAAAQAPARVSDAGVGDLQALLEEAQSEAQKGRKPQALAKYREVLKIDPASSEALSWVEEHLRQKRMYADLRDVLLAASRVPSVSPETRKAQLRDVAGICESQLRDVDTAIQAWKQICQIDRGDEQARDQLRRLLEKGGRWDDLATVLEQEAMGAPDPEQKIALEKKLASLHEAKRKDLGAAAEAWSRIAALSPEDETPIQTAVKLYEKAEKPDLAAQVISDNIGSISDAPTRGGLLQKLGELRGKAGDHGGAGAAYAEAAEALGQAKVWELAEKEYVAAEQWVDAANAVEQRAQLADGKAQAALFARAAELWSQAGDAGAAIEKLERAAELDPANDAYADALEQRYRAHGRESDLVTFLLSRAEKVPDKARRSAARRAAAAVQKQLGDREGSRESLLLLLQDGDDADALRALVDDAGERGDHQEQADLVRRLAALAKDPQEKLTLALREAQLFAEGLDDVDGAIERYEAVLKTLDPRNRAALRAIADLEDRRDNPKGSAGALERELSLVQGEERVEIAQRLAQLYEGPLADPRGAIRALDIVHTADPEDFDAIARLQKLAEEVEDWPRVATLMAQLIEVEGDEEEEARMTVRLAEILHEKLGKGDEALAALEKLADQGNEDCRSAYVERGDALGWKGIVATKLVEWHESSASATRNEALQGAFDRFIEIGREQDACRVAMALARARSASPELAQRLEELATKIKDLDALSVAHELLAKELSGPARAAELVRQAEVLVAAGVDPLEAMQHGESALTSVPPAEVEALLARLAALTSAPGHVIDIYERQVGRCRLPADRLAALARAAQIAAERGANERARSFFELALGGGVQEDTIVALENAARVGDERAGGTALRAILAEALAAGGQGSRDGGRTRAALLRRAATIARTDLGDVERAFHWLGDALVTHVDDASLEALEELGRTVGDLKRVEATLGRALDEVFDGPLVRKLLARRARLRRDVLGDKKGASVDLKKLHDLSPSDQDVMNELSGLLQDLGDHRGMIQLYEDQILRGRDPALRAELARKVARIWEEEIGDARESADAWRRVLRMKAGDQEATAGLERAKAGKLKRPPPVPTGPARASVAPPAPAQPSAPPPQPSTPAPAAVAAARSAAPPAPDPEDVERTADQAPAGLPEPETPTPLSYGELGGAPAGDLDGTTSENAAFDPAAHEAAAAQPGHDAQPHHDAYGAPAGAPQPPYYDPHAQPAHAAYDPNAYAHYDAQAQQGHYDAQAQQGHYDAQAQQGHYDAQAQQAHYDAQQAHYAAQQAQYDAQAQQAHYEAQQAQYAQYAAQQAQYGAPGQPAYDPQVYGQQAPAHYYPPQTPEQAGHPQPPAYAYPQGYDPAAYPQPPAAAPPAHATEDEIQDVDDAELIDE